MISDQMFEDIVSPAYFSSRLMEPLAIIKSIFRDQNTWGNTVQGGKQMEEFMCSEIFSDLYFRHLMGIFMCNVLHVRIEAVVEVDSSGTSTPSVDLESETPMGPESTSSVTLSQSVHGKKSVSPEIVAAVILASPDCRERIEDVHGDLSVKNIGLASPNCGVAQSDSTDKETCVSESDKVSGIAVATIGLTQQSVAVLAVIEAPLDEKEEKEEEGEKGEMTLKRKKIVKKKNYGAGLFYLYSKLNHSCACNTVNQGGSEAEVTLIATADIPKGADSLDTPELYVTVLCFNVM